MVTFSQKLLYFKKEKILNHSNWYEAVAQFCPSTRDAIESNNRSVKEKDDIIQRNMALRTLFREIVKYSRKLVQRSKTKQY